MVNDHRTEKKVSDVQRVLDGDLDDLIKAYLVRDVENKSAELTGPDDE
jgi:peptide chain release factor 2